MFPFHTPLTHQKTGGGVLKRTLAWYGLTKTFKTFQFTFFPANLDVSQQAAENQINKVRERAEINMSEK